MVKCGGGMGWTLIGRGCMACRGAGRHRAARVQRACFVRVARIQDVEAGSAPEHLLSYGAIFLTASGGFGSVD